MSGVYVSLFTPITNIGASLDGADIITFFAPASKCAFAFSVVVNTPEHSNIYSAPTSPHGMFLGSISLYTLIFFHLLLVFHLFRKLLLQIFHVLCHISSYMPYNQLL